MQESEKERSLCSTCTVWLFQHGYWSYDTFGGNFSKSNRLVTFNDTWSKEKEDGERERQTERWLNCLAIWSKLARVSSYVCAFFCERKIRRIARVTRERERRWISRGDTTGALLPLNFCNFPCITVSISRSLFLSSRCSVSCHWHIDNVTGWKKNRQLLARQREREKERARLRLTFSCSHFEITLYVSLTFSPSMLPYSIYSISSIVGFTISLLSSVCIHSLPLWYYSWT